MKKLVINGGKKLEGTIEISGAKNSALKLMAASILTDEEVILSNVPNLSDIHTMKELLESFGVGVELIGFDEKTPCAQRKVRINAGNITNKYASYDIVKKMRASFVVFGPILAKHGKAKVSLPGGCAIGSRPVDLHIYGLKKLGAKIKIKNGYAIANTEDGLRGARIKLSFPSVGATENIMMAAALARGKTILKNPAREPEIVDLANFLNSMGAKISGAGTKKMVIEGVEKLHGAEYKVIADRMEAGTYAIAVAMTDGNALLKGIDIELFNPVAKEFRNAGVVLKAEDEGVRVRRRKYGVKPIHISTKPYPGFPTDMQAQITALLALSDGKSTLKETIFENRFMHVPELNRLGTRIKVKKNVAYIRGVDKLSGASVMATDLRASSTLVLAALVAQGETEIDRIYHLERGYEYLDKKLQACGADVRIEN